MRKVVFIHSAAIDDFVSTAILSQMKDIEIAAILVINADCIAEPAMEVTSQVNQFLGLQDKNVPIALSEARGWNAFPWGYRSDCIRMGTVQELAPYQNKWTYGDPSAEALFESILKEARHQGEKITVLCTGPITTLTDQINQDPSLVQVIDTVVWMGGAIHVPGNLDGGDPSTEPTKIPTLIANKFAEWNVFFDPFAASDTFCHFNHVKLFPLDITNQAKITDAFKAQLKVQADKGYRLSKFVSQAYELVAKESFYEMWNTCATSWLATDTGIFGAFESLKLTVDTWGNEVQGRIVSTNKEKDINDQDVYVNFKDKNLFYNYVLQQLRN